MSDLEFVAEPAVRHQSKARISIAGVSGSGKTYTALELAKGLGNLTVVIDSQYGQSALYAHIFDFRIFKIDTHSPELYAKAIRAFDAQGFDTIIVDSISMAWAGPDGALALVDKAAKKYQGNTYAAWGDVTPLQHDMIDALLSCNAHVIVTLQSKMKHEIVTNDNGKKVPIEIGVEPIQRDGFEYVMDTDIRMVKDGHVATITKTRYSELDGLTIEKPDASLSEFILDQLNVGEAPEQAHWSDSYKNRRALLNVLKSKGIPTEFLFRCYGVNNWGEMKAVPLPEGGSKKIVEEVNLFWVDNA